MLNLRCSVHIGVRGKSTSVLLQLVKRKKSHPIIEVCRQFVTKQDVLDDGILGLQRMRGSPSDITEVACSLLVEWGKTQMDQREARSQIGDSLKDTLKSILKQVCLRVSIDFVRHGLSNKSVAFI